MSMIFKDSFLLYTFCGKITYEDVNYYYMPGRFANWEEFCKEIILSLTKKKRNKFFKKATSCWVKLGHTSAYFLSSKISDTIQ